MNIEFRPAKSIIFLGKESVADAINRLTAEDAKRAEQAAKQSDSPQTVNLNGRLYVWKSVQGGPGEMGRDGGFWMLEANDYEAITERIPLTMNVRQMTTALINANLKPSERDEPISERDSFQHWENARMKAILERAQAPVNAIDAPEPDTDEDIGQYAPWEREAMVDETECLDPYFFDEGDVVQLRSGSPHLTVDEVLTRCEGCDAPLELSVMWFDLDTSCIRRDRVPASSVDHIEG